MVNYKILITKQASKDMRKLKSAGLEGKTKQLISQMQENPFFFPPEYEPLRGNLTGYYSRRINKKHRLVYLVDNTTRTIKILSMWSHYDSFVHEKVAEYDSIEK